MKTSSKPRQRECGLRIKSPGGKAGWLARRLFPRFSTSLYLHYIRLTRNTPTKRRIRDFLGAKPTPWFSHVEIETINRCNGSCAFCPVNRVADPRPAALMNDELFASIIEQLAAIGYSGYLGLFSNNEPLLDKRLERFAGMARRALPKAALNLSTNGVLLRVDAFRSLVPHFDRIVINNYAKTPELRDTVRQVDAFCRTDEGRALIVGKSVEINLRCDSDILTSRAGSAPNRPPPAKPLAMPCALPFSQLVIRPDGGVSLCCNDSLGKITLGNVAREAIADIWLGEKYEALRQTMAERGRGALPLCRECDFVKHDVG